MTRDKYNDLPWDKLTKQAEELIKKGNVELYQKFTCEKCGSRQTITDANTFYTEGQCEECEHITDIKKHGGGFMAHFRVQA